MSLTHPCPLGLTLLRAGMGIEDVQAVLAERPQMMSLLHLGPVAGRGQCGCVHQEAAGQGRFWM